jgi:hypothetical protein
MKDGAIPPLPHTSSWCAHSRQNILIYDSFSLTQYMTISFDILYPLVK